MLEISAMVDLNTGSFIFLLILVVGIILIAVTAKASKTKEINVELPRNDELLSETDTFKSKEYKKYEIPHIYTKEEVVEPTVVEEVVAIPVEETPVEVEPVILNETKEETPVEVVEEVTEEPNVEPAPVEESVEPVAEPAPAEEVVEEEPAVEEVVEAEPVVEEVAPVAEEAAPAEEVAPVAEPLEEPAPVVEEVVEPAAEPVEEVPAEVVEETPVVEEAAPVVEPAPTEEVHFVECIDVYSAQSMITDEDAEALMVVEKDDGRSGSGNRAIVNIDTLSKLYEPNTHITLSLLKNDKVLGRKVSSYKVLARGTIDKPLVVEANAFSMDAVKMIVLTGGKVIVKK